MLPGHFPIVLFSRLAPNETFLFSFQNPDFVLFP